MTLDPLSRPEDVAYDDIAPAGVEKKKEARAKSFDMQKDQERNDLLKVLRTEEGRGFVLRLISHCQPYQTMPMGDIAQAAVAEGRRRVGLWVIGEIQRVDPELYPHLLLAHLKHQRDMKGMEATMAAAKPPASL